MATLPLDLQKHWDDMDAADRRADELSARLSDDRFFWQPDDGRRWSVALCLDHLAVSNAVYGEAIAGAVATAKANGWTRRGPAVPGFFGRKFANSLEPPVKLRTSAPAKITPAPARSREAILRAFLDAHDRLRQLLLETATIDANKATFANPFMAIVRVRVATAFHIVSAHDRRHLWQADGVVKQLP